jgi:hypothetical protein
VRSTSSLQTQASGGIIGGKVFPSLSGNKVLNLDRVLDNVDSALKEWKGISPFNRAEKAEAMLAASEAFVTAVDQSPYGPGAFS